MTARMRMRMAELVSRSGVSRETIHYYLREGLLPRPVKGGKTVAYYDESHLERLHLIRRLREEKYMPLAVIRRMLEAGPAGPSARDVETLTDVLSIDPTFGCLGELATVDDEAVRVALELGVLGPDAREPSGNDPTEQRVLGSVAEALALEGDARQLTLNDLRACAEELTRLVDAEATLFFDLVIERGNMISSVQALRAGRAAVARFITAYRDLMLRRVVDGVLGMLDQGPAQLQHPAYLELGTAELARLEVRATADRLREEAERGDAAAANDLAWHLFVLGSADELAGLQAAVYELLRPRARFLVHAARAELGDDDAAVALGTDLQRSGQFALGQVLWAQRRLVRLVGVEGAGSDSAPDRSSFLEHAVPVLHELSRVEPGQDADTLASVCAFHRRGLLRLALPRVLGRHGLAVVDLERALEVLLAAPGRIGAPARARLEGNLRLSLARCYAEAGGRAAALEQLERARAIDSRGPIGHQARAEDGLLREIPASGAAPVDRS